jgi:hypothetical protein
MVSQNEKLLEVMHIKQASHNPSKVNAGSKKTTAQVNDTGEPSPSPIRV